MSNEYREDPPSSRDEVSDVARDVYLAFLGEELAGEPSDFEALCRERPELAAELRRLRRAETETRSESAHLFAVAVDRGKDASSSELGEPELLELLNRIALPRPRAERYSRGIELGRGSMGRVYSAWDPELARVLALKVLHTRADGETPSAPTDRVLRFLREAQITSQLDHPGIVPVHELGLDEDGRPFFAMKLVRGRDLKSVFASVWTGEDGWSLVRALGVLHKVCEAMGYAHAKGIVHRDLKPSNIMVGRFGEVFVMDWGVAHVDRPTEDQGGPERTAFIRAARRSVADDATLTGEGAILGTAAYMSPEQATGDTRLLGVWTDVYAVGTLLYHLLARRAPYVGESSSGSTLDVLERLVAGPPEPLLRVAPDAPPELVSICERAMARQPLSRYPGMSELAEDLRAYIEGRVVRAHRTGVRAEIRKWILRNRTTTQVAALAILLGTAAGLAFLRWRGDRGQLDLLQRLREPSQVLDRFDFLWPASRERMGKLRAWIVEAERVWSQGDDYRAYLQELRGHAHPRDLDAPEERRARALTEFRIGHGKKTIAYFERERERLQTEGGITFEGHDLAEVEHELTIFRGLVLGLEEDLRAFPRQAWTFETADEDILHERLSRIDKELNELGGEDEPRPRIEIARRVLAALERSERADFERGVSWEEASRCIGDPACCRAYDGLQLAPQEHLVPLGPDPRSGLWEFAHALTGEIPTRGAGGVLALHEASAVVLVLVPAGTLRRGSQILDPAKVNHDPHHQRLEQPVLGIQLEAYFLSKFELTLAQWERLTGQDRTNVQNWPVGSRTRPVVGLTWEDAMGVLACIGLTLPTEAQWEHAARAGTGTPWWTGSEEAALTSAANLWEPELGTADVVGIEDRRSAGPDGWIGAAPVGRLLPNSFGLHDVHGNAAELARDQGHVAYFDRNILIGTGESLRNIDLLRIARGGSYQSDPRDARCASRRLLSRDENAPDVGLRPSLDLEE